MSDQRKLTIALFFATPGTSWGGMEKHTADLAHALASRGHTVHVLGHPGYRSRFDGDVHFHPMPVHLGRRNPWLHFALRRCIRRISPDILHAQGNKAAQLAGQIKLSTGGVRVGTVHGSKSSHRAFKHLDTVVAVSRLIFDNLDHPNKKLILNGVSPRSQAPRSSQIGFRLSPRTANVIAAGRLEPVKGFATLIRAWAQLPQDVANSHLTIFGEGSLRPELEHLTSKLGLADRVTLAGYQADLAHIYPQADLVVISSEREGLPYVLIESLQAGCPVISTPVSGPTSLLPPQALCPDHEPASLARLLDNALADLSALKEAEQSAMAFAREKLTLEFMTTETERVYLEALAARQKRTT